MTAEGDPVADPGAGPGESDGAAPRPHTSPPPRPSAAEIVKIDLPESLRYRLKNVLLGPPTVNEKLGDERLGRPSALGVLAPDCISSSAYGTEEMLTQLIPFIGLAGFILVVPVTMAILGVLFFVTLSYLDVIAFYTKAGGAYVVARENFGPKVAQIAAVALLIDYTVTVAVQTAAGTAALTSAVPSFRPYTVAITLAVIGLLLYGNLRGIREAGKIFAFPTYFFIVSLGLIVVAGYIREFSGTLHVHAIPAYDAANPTVAIGHPGSGILYGATFIIILRAFANGGSSLTGLEAISNGVGAFREPTSRNARQTLVVMSSLLAFLVLGVTLIAHWTHAVPYISGSPSVVSQEVQYVVGTGPVGKVIFYVVQLATMLILYTGGNTSFNGFPFLASFVAEDKYLPKQLTRRGHRLAFSNGIIVLTIVAVLLIVATGAQLSSLVALYAIGVFTGFAMAGSGMIKHHIVQKGRRWKLGVVINAISAFLTALIVLIFATVKFTEGAWVVVIVGPVMYLGLIRLHRQYMSEEIQLEEGASEAAEAPVLSRHAVVVLVDRLDMATARALQYARTLHPDELPRCPFRPGPDRVRRTRGGVAPTRPVRSSPRHPGVRGPSAHPCRPRTGRRNGGRPEDRTHHSPSPADLRLGPQPGAPRQHGRAHRHRRRPPRTCERHGGALPARGRLVVESARLAAQERGGEPLLARGQGRRPGCRQGDDGAGPLPPPGVRRAGPGDHPDRGRPVAPAGQGGRPGSLGPGPTPCRNIQSRVPTLRRQRDTPAGVPGPSSDSGHPARRTPGGGGDGRGLGPPAGHPQPRLRADRRARGGGRTHLRRGVRGAFLAPDPRCRYVLPDCRVWRAPWRAPALGRPAVTSYGGPCPSPYAT